MTTQTKDSFYLERLKTKFDNKEGYWSVGDTSTSIWQPHTRNKFDLFTQTKLIDITFDEQTYKDFQLIHQTYCEFAVATWLYQFLQHSNKHL